MNEVAITLDAVIGDCDKKDEPDQNKDSGKIPWEAKSESIVFFFRS
jgi:hypothetical protein